MGETLLMSPDLTTFEEAMTATFEPLFSDGATLAEHLSGSSSDDALDPMCYSPSAEDETSSPQPRQFDGSSPSSESSSPISPAQGFYDPEAPASAPCSKRGRKRAHHEVGEGVPAVAPCASVAEPAKVPLVYATTDASASGATPVICYSSAGAKRSSGTRRAGARQQVQDSAQQGPAAPQPQQQQSHAATRSALPAGSTVSATYTPVECPSSPSPGASGGLPPDEELMRMTSEQIEEFIRTCKASRSLVGAGDERRLRKVRRLIKNREYAQMSRNKKKQLVGEMEKDLNGVRDENTRLARELAAERARCAELEAENEDLRRALSAAGVRAPAKRACASPADSAIASPCVSPSHFAVGGPKTAACLLAVVALFGLAIGPFAFNRQSSAANSLHTSPTARTLMSTEDNFFSAISAAFGELVGPAARAHASWLYGPPEEPQLPLSPVHASVSVPASPMCGKGSDSAYVDALELMNESDWTDNNSTGEAGDWVSCVCER